MSITVTAPSVVMENPSGIHNYFGWPSVARLQDGSLAAVASGYRTKHICPFGKAVLCRSYDDGGTWTAPEIVIDTTLDDRDSGIVPFGKNDVILTSFNNTIAFQRSIGGITPYASAYLDEAEKRGAEARDLGSNFKISHDGGYTFGELHHVPVTSPHGPCAMPDGTLLYVGRQFSPANSHRPEDTCVQCWRVFPDGTVSYLSSIANVSTELLSCEPHTLLTQSGRLIVHIRVQNRETFTIYQSVSEDMGKTFSEPRQILAQKGGSPAHMIQTADGTIYSVYGYREAPYGIRVMRSRDDGETWETDRVLWDGGPGSDLGYPCSVIRRDGSILTVFYAHLTANEPAVIASIVWKWED